ncbi:hypothetical protein [Nitratiruptor sp. YY08-10]|uniref:hypothetical protein n=1 Tax=Nitratiruptor sp. YY08-10 TaxID=2724897 RepID=UPI0019153202|nr:hypothetical protein [Nitratiruptor sp. YY08-10]BCD59592.1 transcriptional regulator [Nitratiruptor sp. YY08-10]BCD83068.1 transcriptional regulator [Nitratiruptor phage NrS-2]
MEENIVKKVCKELGLTYRELAEKTGYKLDTINKAASTGKVSEPLQKAIELLIELENTKKELQNYEELKRALKKALE